MALNMLFQGSFERDVCDPSRIFLRVRRQSTLFCAGFYSQKLLSMAHRDTPVTYNFIDGADISIVIMPFDAALHTVIPKLPDSSSLELLHAMITPGKDHVFLKILDFWAAQTDDEEASALIDAPNLSLWTAWPYIKSGRVLVKISMIFGISDSRFYKIMNVFDHPHQKYYTDVHIKFLTDELKENFFDCCEKGYIAPARCSLAVKAKTDFL